MGHGRVKFQHAVVSRFVSFWLLCVSSRINFDSFLQCLWWTFHSHKNGSICCLSFDDHIRLGKPLSACILPVWEVRCKTLDLNKHAHNNICDIWLNFLCKKSERNSWCPRCGSPKWGLANVWKFWMIYCWCKLNCAVIVRFEFLDEILPLLPRKISTTYWKGFSVINSNAWYGSLLPFMTNSNRSPHQLSICSEAHVSGFHKMDALIGGTVKDSGEKWRMNTSWCLCTGLEASLCLLLLSFPSLVTGSI